MLDKQTLEVFYEKLTFIYLEMPKFRKGEAELITRLDKWLYLLKNLPKLPARPQRLQEKVFDKLFIEAEIAKLTPEEMRNYQESLKTYRDNYSVIETAKQEGRSEGRNEGRMEERVEIARELKKNGVSIDVIEKSTGLTRDQIEKF